MTTTYRPSHTPDSGDTNPSIPTIQTEAGSRLYVDELSRQTKILLEDLGLSIDEAINYGTSFGRNTPLKLTGGEFLTTSKAPDLRNQSRIDPPVYTNMLGTRVEPTQIALASGMVLNRMIDQSQTGGGFDVKKLYLVIRTPQKSGISNSPLLQGATRYSPGVHSTIYIAADKIAVPDSNLLLIEKSR